MPENFFEADLPLRPEIVSGLFRESQIVVMAGPFHVGKTPLLADLAVHICRGLPWNGRRVQQRPVVHFDFESSDPGFRRTYRNISKALGITPPRVPDEIEPYILGGDFHDPRTEALLRITSPTEMMALLNSILVRKPNALFLFDPIEMAFHLDVLKKAEVLRQNRRFREMFARYPQSAILSSHNLRKTDTRRTTATPNLLADPTGWLQEISGTLDVVNRSDVRLGIDQFSESAIVVNGIRRGEDMHPLLLAPVDEDPDELGGFKRISTKHLAPLGLFSEAQASYWGKMAEQFQFNDYANNGIPKSSLSRIIHRAISLGMLTKDDSGLFTKAQF